MSPPKGATQLSPDPVSYGKALRATTRTWTQIREAFAKRDIKAGSGWDDFLEKLESDDDATASLRDQVGDVYRELMLLGRRSVRLFQDAAFNWSNFANAARTVSVGQSKFTPAYPLPLDPSILHGLATLEPELVEVRGDGADVMLVYSSHRTYTTRDELNPSQLGPNVPPVLAGFERLIGERVVNYQGFDAVLIRPGDDRVEFWIDDSHSIDVATMDEMVARLFNAVAQIHAPIMGLLTSGLNLFPAIREIYDDKYAGSVAKLWFSTPTGGGSIKREIMRKKGEDLRDDLFHSAGVHKVGKAKISPYAIEVDFEIEERQIPIGLKGNFRDLHSAGGASLFTAHVDNCISIRQLKRALSKLVTYL